MGPSVHSAFDLVNRLVADLISTTNSYKIVQEKEVRIAQDLALSQAQLFPLRKENARLARENHDLHNDTIRLNDEIRNATEDSSRQLQRVHEQLQDSRFLCESLNEQLRHKNETIDKLRMVRKRTLRCHEARWLKME
jgi:predicted RNase H-like nuclease (RuvC/YqgF family)